MRSMYITVPMQTGYGSVRRRRGRSRDDGELADQLDRLLAQD